MNKDNRKATVYFFVVVAGIAAVLLSAVFILHANKDTWFPSKGPSSPLIGENESLTQSTEEDESSAPTFISENGIPCINYSNLQFAETKDIEYPTELNKMIIDELPPLTDFMLSHSEAIIKATVTAIHFNDYSDNYNDTTGTKPYAFFPNSIVYTVRIDKIYYVMAGLTMNVGDSFVIEESLWASTPCTKHPQCQVQWNRQYILPLSFESMKEGYTESPYSLEYSNMPQIECTEDGGYVFYAHKPLEPYGSYEWFGWGELINEDTLSVVMDHQGPEGPNDSWEGFIHYRKDDQFEEEFQSLCDQWCR
jgi:hypothetical protein